jgi:tyrosinase
MLSPTCENRAIATGAASPRHPAAPLKHRRSVGLLTADQLREIRNAFASAQRISDDRGYRYFAGIHGLPLPMSCSNAHGTPYFLPWHRAYLYFFELALQRFVPRATLPWWDWRVEPGEMGEIPKAFAAEKDGRRANPLHSAEVDPVALEQGRRQRPPLKVADRTERHPGQLNKQFPLPTVQEVKDVLALGDFMDFTQNLEQLHNRVHVWVGGNRGHMSQIPFAAFDPIFWAHHTMIDRIWRLWQRDHAGGAGGLPSSLLDEALPPFRMTVRQTADVKLLGYDYAAATASQEV